MKNINITLAQLRREMLKSAQALIDTAENSAADIIKAADIIAGAFKKGKKLLICGNGGSAADSQHIAAELVVRFLKERKALPAIALTTDSSIITSEANDHSFDTVFSRQVEALGKKGDVLLAITTSGRSPNVIEAAKAAKKMGLVVVGLTGPASGTLGKYCRVCIKAAGDKTFRIQESMLMAEHAICDLVEKDFVK
ncbi:MAG: SIS domain-containing protein [Candidatus Edwardsbacteria bacterium]|nr:SIS domain-containing protein [Candidatus Edwardsbacteria bacterium]MBU1577565.1 SIS domain-containing protein [Candidatus Edwardsbacteria bacterium]MBU2462595.1 SIS domain-containing protein [Candidatus Edwardsbacteria bacterium]MBU2593660.1 SIS domain-containing protein [Candidatus Edwardsbacteria bacterium]